MNIQVSYEWLKQYVKLKEKPEEFARRVSLSGPAVEKIIPRGEALDRVVVGHVKEVKPHPNADKLRLAITDIGKKTVTIVCGGSNLKPDQWVAVALVGARVRWHGEGDLIELTPAEIRGVKSDGMICAANEIGLFDAFPHAEREILDLGVAIPEIGTLKPGTPLADALGLSDDVILDIEVTTNRPDALGVVGLAREASAILNRPFVWKSKTLPKAKGKAVPVKIAAKKLCPRYMAARIDGVKIGPSPWWVKQRLMSAGLNSINNVVDITNYVMLEMAQPMHAFDASMVEKGIQVRLARSGETIKALDGKDYALSDSMLVIADAKKPLAVAGIMGGEASGVYEQTTSIILEAATFDPVSVRRTSRALNLQSDSQTRFEKGLSTEALPPALARAIELVLDVAGGTLAAPPTDVRVAPYRPVAYSISSDEVRTLIGVDIPPREMIAVLRRLGFHVSTKGKTIKAVVPWWRDHDIEDGRDLVEEIARVYGYANVPPVVPLGLQTRPTDSVLAWEDRIRDIAKGAGCTETYSYSFTSKELAVKAGFDPSRMYHIQNPLSVETEVMRTKLLPSLLQIAAENKEREPALRLFELAKSYYPTPRGLKDLPNEQVELCALFTGMPDAWKVAKGFVEHVFAEIGLPNVRWVRLSGDPFWHPGRAVQAFVDDHLVATLGEISPGVTERFKLEARVGGVDIPLQTVLPLARTSKRYAPVSPFPSSKRDLAVLVDAVVEYTDIAQTIQSVDPLVASVEWFDTYKGKGVPEGKKSLAMHLEFSSSDRTLESGEVDSVMEKIINELKKKFGAEVRK